MSDHHDPHTGLHSEQGALAGEHPGRATNPVVKVHDLAWLEFEKPDLDRAEAVRPRLRVQHGAAHPGRAAAAGHRPGCAVRADPPGAASRFVGPAFRAADSADVLRLAEATGADGHEAAGERGRADAWTWSTRAGCAFAWSSDTARTRRAARPGSR